MTQDEETFTEAVRSILKTTEHTSVRCELIQYNGSAQHSKIIIDGYMAEMIVMVSDNPVADLSFDLRLATRKNNIASQLYAILDIITLHMPYLDKNVVVVQL